MNKEFQKLLEGAEGRSDYIIAVCVDIRDFTPFCNRVDSFLTGIYIKKVYLKIINGYFKDATFYKPAGDGLLIAIQCKKEKDIEAIAKSTMDSCLRLVEDFGSLCIGEPMINFPTPEKIGIGMTRGNACCLHSGGEILDYSGRTLNLASRLMDMARPSGIVLDGAFGLDLLSDEAKELFSEEIVYIRGIAEEKPIKVYYSKKHTIISKSFKQPLKEPKWKTITEEKTLATWKDIGGQYWISLSEKPLDSERILLVITYDSPFVEGIVIHHESSINSDRIDYKVKGNKHRVELNLDIIVPFLKKEGVKEDMNVIVEVTYPVK